MRHPINHTETAQIYTTFLHHHIKWFSDDCRFLCPKIRLKAISTQNLVVVIFGEYLFDWNWLEIEGQCWGGRCLSALARQTHQMTSWRCLRTGWCNIDQQHCSSSCGDISSSHWGSRGRHACGTAYTPTCGCISGSTRCTRQPGGGFETGDTNAGCIPNQVDLSFTREKFKFSYNIL